MLAEQLGDFIGALTDREFRVAERGNSLTTMFGQCLRFQQSSMPLLPACVDITAAPVLLLKLPQLAAKSEAVSGTGCLFDQQLESLKVLLTAG